MILTLLAALAALQVPEPTQLAESTWLFATPAGNLVATITPEGAYLVGALSTAATPGIQAAIARRTTSPVRYVIAAPHAGAVAEGDAGWRALGALVAAHENLSGRMDDRARPQAAFSQVLKLVVGGHDMHAVHQQPGYSDADVLVHFENVAVVYLGESLPGDGYPMIDSALGGTLDGLIQTLNPWAGATRNRMIGARGGPQSGADVRAFRDMLTTMRDRVRSLKQAGRTVEQVVAERPSREFDARYGSGRVTPEAFVRMLFREIRP